MGKYQDFVARAREEGYSDREIWAYLMSESRQEEAPRKEVNVPLGGGSVSVGDVPARDFVGEAGELAAAGNRGIIQNLLDVPINAVNRSLGGYAGLADLLAGSSLAEAVDTSRSVSPFPNFSRMGDVLLPRAPGEGNFIEPSPRRDMIQQGGEVFFPFLMGAAGVQGRDISKPVGALMEALGAGSAKPTAAADALLPAIPDTPVGRELALKRGQSDTGLIGYKINDAGKVVKDATHQAAVKAGVREDIVPMVTTADKTTRGYMRRMMDVLEGGFRDARFRRENRVSSVIGEAIDNRMEMVVHENRRAGKAIDRIAKNKLTKEVVDIRPPMYRFMNNLKEEGINFDPNTGYLDFTDSTIEGLDDLQNLMTRVVNRLYQTKTPTAYDVHRAKRFLDRQVSYGKMQTGLDGAMEGIIKTLRRGLDEVLDQKFPEYDGANTTYKETIEIINDIQRMAGPRVDLTADNAKRAYGVMSRKLLSNYRDGSPMEVTFKALQDFAERATDKGLFARQGPVEDIGDLVQFESEIRRLFPEAVAENTFQGEGASFGRGLYNMGTGNVPGIAQDMAEAAGKKLKKMPSRDDVVKALRDILED